MRVFGEHGLQDVEEIAVFDQGVGCWGELRCGADR